MGPRLGLLRDEGVLGFWKEPASDVTPASAAKLLERMEAAVADKLLEMDPEKHQAAREHGACYMATVKQHHSGIGCEPQQDNTHEELNVDSTAAVPLADASSRFQAANARQTAPGAWAGQRG